MIKMVCKCGEERELKMQVALYPEICKCGAVMTELPTEGDKNGETPENRSTT